MSLSPPLPNAWGARLPYWFAGYSLSGQLALWAGKAASTLPAQGPITRADIGGVAVVCPSLDSNRSLQYLVSTPQGRLLEQAITATLLKIARQLQQAYPDDIDASAVERVNSIYSFDQELVIDRLGFATVEDYYTASSPLPFLPDLDVPVLMLYAADDPLFDPTIIPDLTAANRAKCQAGSGAHRVWRSCGLLQRRGRAESGWGRRPLVGLEPGAGLDNQPIPINCSGMNH